MTPEEKKAFLESDAGQKQCEDSMTKTRTRIMLDKHAKFLASEIFSRPILFRHDLGTPTAGTDGKRVLIDPEFWLSLNGPKRERVLFHEIWHVLNFHCDPKRRGHRDAYVWNLAADVIVEATGSVASVGEPIGEVKLPSGKIRGAVEPEYNGDCELQVNGKTLKVKAGHTLAVEEVYDLIVQHAKQHPPPPCPQHGKGGKGQPQDGQGDGQDGQQPGDGAGQDGSGSGKHSHGKAGKPCTCGRRIVATDKKGNELGQDEHIEETDESKELTDEDRSEIENAVRRMVVESKMRGTMPGWLEEQLSAMLEQKVDWRSELRELVMPEVKAYTSYSRTNRRSYSLGMNLPGMVKEGVNVATAIDVSGSMGMRELKYIVGEMRNIFKSFEPGAVHIKVYLHDTDVQATFDLNDEVDLDAMDIRGGGGTDHHKVIARAEEDGCRVLINFTDGYSSFPGETTIGKMLWVVTDKRGADQIPAHLGRVIPVSLDDMNNE